MSETSEKPSNTKKKRKSRAGLSVKSVELDLIHKKLMTALDRQATHLLRATHAGILSRDDSNSLIGTLKLIKDLRSIEKDKESELTDKVLEEISGDKDE